MKRLLSLMLALVSLASFASCGKSGTGEPSPTPASNGEISLVFDVASRYASPAAEQVFETGDAVYFLCESEGGYMMYFSDKEYKDFMPLCGRPDCLHNSEDCSAFIKGAENCLKAWICGGHIYYAFDETDSDPVRIEVWRMGLDGSGHEQYLTVPIDVRYSSYVYSWLFHNKYMLISFSGAEGGSSEYARELILVELECGEPVPTVIEESGGVSRGFVLAGDGDILYGVWDDVKNGTGTYVMKANLADRTVERVCPIPFWPDEAVISGGKLYLYNCWNDFGIACMDLETNELTVITRDEPADKHWFKANDKYLIGAGTGYEGEYRGTRIYDLGFNLIQELPYETYGTNIYVTYITESFVFGIEADDWGGFDLDAHTPTWYLDLNDIGTEGFGWHRWEP